MHVAGLTIRIANYKNVCMSSCTLRKLKHGPHWPLKVLINTSHNDIWFQPVFARFLSKSRFLWSQLSSNREKYSCLRRDSKMTYTGRPYNLTYLITRCVKTIGTHHVKIISTDQFQGFLLNCCKIQMLPHFHLKWPQSACQLLGFRCKYEFSDRLKPWKLQPI